MKSGHNDIEQEEGKILFQSLIDFDFSFPEFYGSFHANRHAILNNNCQEPPVLSFFDNDDGVVLVEGLQVVFMLKEKTFFFPLNRTKERGASEGEQKKYYWCHNSQDDDHHRKIFFIYIWSKDFWDINSISNPHHGKCHSAFALIQKKKCERPHYVYKQSYFIYWRWHYKKNSPPLLINLLYYASVFKELAVVMTRVELME